MGGRMKGQSTLEYVIILAAIVGAIILVATSLKPRLETTYNNLGNKMQSKVDSVSFDDEKKDEEK